MKQTHTRWDTCLRNGVRLGGEHPPVDREELRAVLAVVTEHRRDAALRVVTTHMLRECGLQADGRWYYRGEGVPIGSDNKAHGEVPSLAALAHRKLLGIYDHNCERLLSNTERTMAMPTPLEHNGTLCKLIAKRRVSPAMPKPQHATSIR